MERGQAQTPIPSGHLYDPRGRAVALDAPRVRLILHPLLATFRTPLVAHHLHPRGLKPHRTRRELHTLPKQRQHFHRLLPLLRGDTAHDRLRIQDDHRRVPRSHICNVSSEHRRCVYSGIHGMLSLFYAVTVIFHRCWLVVNERSILYRQQL